MEWNTKTYGDNARFVSVYGEDVLSWLSPQEGERILDLGCGDGPLTLKIAEAGAEVVGVDASASFIETAKASGLDARVMDGHALNFDEEFDAVFSNAALHWMTRPHDVVSGVRRALKTGGRFVGEFGGHGNVAAIASAMHAVGEAMGSDTDAAFPWYFPTVDEYRLVLEQHGFVVDEITSFYRPTPLPTDIRGWLEVMRAPFFDQFEARKEEAYERVERALKPSLCNESGQWMADYVRLRFKAHLGS